MDSHGPEDSTTTCQLHMRKFEDGDTITIEPFRAKAFPVVKDLVVDRSAFDSITRQVDSLRLEQEVLLMETHYLYPRATLTRLWMLLPVSGVVHAWLHVKMPLLCFLHRLRPVT